jgi:hypothetical protein
MYQPIRFKNTTALPVIASLKMLCANVCFAQVEYSTFNYPDAMGGSTGLSGVRGAGGQNVYITGAYRPAVSPTPTPACSVELHGLLYEGSLSGGGNWTVLDYPSSAGTTVTGTVLYGPDALPSNDVRVAGSYTTCETGIRNHGLLYEGLPDGSGTWLPLDFPMDFVRNTIPHSTMGGLVVGNFDTDLVTGKAFVYEIDAGSWVELVKPGVLSITAYGIWYNGGTSYTITGGYSYGNLSGIDHGSLVNWDSATQTASDWTSYDFDNGRIDVAVSHFNGITGDKHGGFYLTGDWLGVVPPNAGVFFAHVRRTPGQTFSKAHWTPIAYPSADSTSGDTVFENYVLGIYTAGGSVTNGFVAKVRGHR